MRAGRGERAIRGSALAAFSGLLTGVGHAMGGASIGDLGLLLVLVPLLAGVFVSLAERSRGPLGTVAVLGAGQVVLHYLMVLLHPAQDGGPAALGGWSMLLMHAAVTLVSAAGLRHADAAVLAARCALRRVLPRRLPPAPADRPLPTLAVPDPGASARLARVLLVAHVRRGPPVRC